VNFSFHFFNNCCRY